MFATTDADNPFSRRLIVSLAALALVAVALVAWAVEEREQRVTGRPAVEVASAHTHFDALPRLPRSAPVAPVSSSGTRVSRVFGAPATTPGRVIEFYADALVGWRRVDGPATATATARAGQWTSGRYTVTVTADIERGAADATPVTRFSVVLTTAR